MSRRVLPAVVVALAAVAVLLAPPASAAGSSAFADDAGDATGLDPMPPGTVALPEGGPVPNEAQLDLLKVTATSDGKKVTFVATVAKAGIPDNAIGTTFRFWFTYDGADYQLIAQRPNSTAANTTTSGIFFRARAVTSAELSCRDCSIRYDLKANTITASAGLAGLSGGIRQSKPASKPLAPGMKLTGLAVLSQRLLVAADRTVDVGRTVTVDVAHGEQAPLTL
jgi:hypothetical protein